MQEENYWTRALKQRMSRRSLFRTGAVAGLGLASAYGVGCGGTEQPKASTTPSGGTTTAAPTVAPTAATSQPKYGGTLRVIGLDPLGFDPHETFSYRTHETLSFIYSKTLNYPIGPKADPGDYSPGPGLAEKWEQADETTFVFSVRQGVKFQNKPPVNGRLLDGEDIKYTIERMLASNFTYKDLFEQVAKIEVPSKDKVKFTLKQPYVPFLTNLGNHYTWILAKEVADKGPDFKKPEWAIGTGPFMLDSYTPNVKCVFKKNPDFWTKGQPYVDTIEWIVMPDTATQLATLRAGNLDICNVVAPEVDNMKKSNPNLQWQMWISIGGNIFYYRCDKKPYDDIRVRRAINLCIDRKGWLDAFNNGQGSIDNGPPVLAGYKDWKLPLEQIGPGAAWWKYDVEQAKKLMAEAGYANGFKAKFDTTNGYGQTTVDKGEALKDFLSKIGIETTINIKEYADWMATGHTGIYDEMAYGAMTPYIELDEWTYGMFHSKASANKGHINNSELDVLLAKQRTQYNKTERKQTMDQIQKLIADQCYYFYDPVGTTNTAWQPYVKNYAPHSGYDFGTQLAQVWIDKS